MNCLECQEWLQHRLDGGHDGPAARSASELDDHLARCVTCRERTLAAQRVLDAGKHRPRLALPADFSQRVVGSVLRDREQRRRRMRLRLVYTSVLAASVLLLLFVGSIWTPSVPEVNVPIVLGTPKETVAPKPLPEPGPVTEPVPPLPASLGDRLADSTREQALVLWAAASPLGPLPPLAPELEPFEPASPTLKKAGQEVSASVQTVTRASRQAFSYFVRELPSLDVPQRN